MNLKKLRTYPLDKCYAIAEICYHGEPHFVVAAEKVDKCLLFTREGELVDTIWEGPGGTMSIVPLPSDPGSFLATQRMYSPNDAQDAVIVAVSPKEGGGWMVNEIAKVPFAHRFDLLSTPAGKYLVVATIKGGHSHTDDWSTPGQFLVAPFEGLDTDTPLRFSVVMDDVFHNHGYLRRQSADGDYAVISGDQGVFAIYPPKEESGSWVVKQLLAEGVSDMAFVDFDGDGNEEMITICPFHGDTIRIYKDIGKDLLEQVWELPEKREFSHSIHAGTVGGKPIAIIGHRKGPSRDLMGFSYDGTGYRMEILDKDCGSTNILLHEQDGAYTLVSTNREINEIAFYRLEV
ncbi:MAG: hypothetical protein RBT44_10180 [Sphaerochaetaceae bacterium]|jgi:hypothetical protein|nr:hypothetical protein [Sphaerochaetaceae bacterium]